MRKLSVTCAVLVALASAAAHAAITETPVRFARGASSATYSDSVEGDDSRDYILQAARGQQLSIELRSRASVHFNLLRIGGEKVLYNSTIEGNHYDKVLPESGRYAIRVYQAGRGLLPDARAGFRLSVAIRGKAVALAPPGVLPVAGAGGGQALLSHAPAGACAAASGHPAHSPRPFPARACR